MPVIYIKYYSMKHKDYTGIVPGQFTGNEIEADATVTCKGETEAKAFYSIVRDRLLSVNHWHKTAGLISAHFRLYDVKGNTVTGKAEKGHYIRIDIPGPGSKEGGGYDWANIIDIKEIDEGTVQSIGILVHPSNNPLGDKAVVAHFYAPYSSSSFIITREGTNVIATIIDRNVAPNEATSSLIDKIRHTAVGMSAIGSFSKAQWQNLVNGLVAR